MKKTLELNFNQKEEMALVCHALSNPVRLDLLNAIASCPGIMSDLAAQFDLPLSTVALHIKTLKKAGLISVSPIPGSKGSQKLCALITPDITISLSKHGTRNHPSYFYREVMPIGSYFDYSIHPSCGIASELCDLGFEDTLTGFYSPERFKAQLIWLSHGYLEYRFSNTAIKNNSVSKICFTLECCSETIGYGNQWRSDISIWINGIEIGFIESLGDYGGRRGKLTPGWWGNSNTQYGLLHSIHLTETGCFIDDILVSDETITSLAIKNNDFFKFRIGVKEDARYCGGLNLFGEKFGDYEQPIVMEVYTNEN